MVAGFILINQEIKIRGRTLLKSASVVYKREYVF